MLYLCEWVTDTDWDLMDKKALITNVELYIMDWPL